jgi:hypothetical protein
MFRKSFSSSEFASEDRGERYAVGGLMSEVTYGVFLGLLIVAFAANGSRSSQVNRVPAIK